MAGSAIGCSWLALRDLRLLEPILPATLCPLPPFQPPSHLCSQSLEQEPEERETRAGQQELSFQHGRWEGFGKNGVTEGVNSAGSGFLHHPTSTA